MKYEGGVGSSIKNIINPRNDPQWHKSTLRPRQNGRRFADDIFKCIFFNENVKRLIEISLRCTPKGPINNIPALVQIMAWCHYLNL